MLIEKLNRYHLALLTLFIFILALLFLVYEEIGHGKNFEISFLDVGQGDATLIQTKNGFNVLIDVGRGSAVLRGLSKKLSPIEDIDLVLLTHNDADHTGGLRYVLDHYDVDYLAHSTHGGFIDTLKWVNPNIQRIRLDKPFHMTADDVMFSHYWPFLGNITEKNASSSIILVQVEGVRILLTGDAPSIVEDRIIEVFEEDLSKVQILKAGHHGSYTSTGSKFLEKTKPEIVVISVGANNPYGHPHETVVSRLNKIGAEIFTTAEDGTISFVLEEGSIRKN